MATTNFIPNVLRTLPHDGWLLLVTRFARLFAYGSLSVILVFYLVGLGLKEAQAGLVLTLTLVGDVVVSLYLTTRADRIGRRRMLFVGSILMAAAGLAFACTSNLLFLVVAGTIGVISPSGHKVGRFSRLNKLRCPILFRRRLAQKFLRGTAHWRNCNCRCNPLADPVGIKSSTMPQGGAHAAITIYMIRL
jgi:hypothetical protein